MMDRHRYTALPEHVSWPRILGCLQIPGCRAFKILQFSKRSRQLWNCRREPAVEPARFRFNRAGNDWLAAHEVDVVDREHAQSRRCTLPYQWIDRILRAQETLLAD